MQKSKMAVWGALTNSCEKKRSKKRPTLPGFSVSTWEWMWSPEQQGEGSLGEKGRGSFAKAFPEICSQVSLEL